MPSVQEALQRLEREMAVARQGKLTLLKVIHGYGSSGAGGDIRLAVQRRLYELAEGGQIRACIFGENWSKTDDATWRLLQAESALKSDPDLGRRNQGHHHRRAVTLRKLSEWTRLMFPVEPAGESAPPEPGQEPPRSEPAE